MLPALLAATGCKSLELSRQSGRTQEVIDEVAAGIDPRNGPKAPRGDVYWGTDGIRWYAYDPDKRTEYKGLASVELASGTRVFLVNLELSYSWQTLGTLMTGGIANHKTVKWHCLVLRERPMVKGTQPPAWPKCCQDGRTGYYRALSWASPPWSDWSYRKAEFNPTPDGGAHLVIWGVPVRILREFWKWQRWSTDTDKDKKRYDLFQIRLKKASRKLVEVRFDTDGNEIKSSEEARIKERK